MSDVSNLLEGSPFFTSVGHLSSAVCIRTSNECSEVLDNGGSIHSDINEHNLDRPVDLAVQIYKNEENVSTKIVKLLHSYNCTVNKMVSDPICVSCCC